MRQGREPLVSHASHIVDTYQELESPMFDRTCFYGRIVRLRSATEIDLADNCFVQRRWGCFPRGRFPHVPLG